MATGMKKGLSDRLKRRLRANIAKRLVECDLECLRETSAPSSSDSLRMSECAMVGDSHTVVTATDLGSATGYESGQDHHPSIEDDATNLDCDDYKPVGCTSVLSESSSGSGVHLDDDSDLVDDSESLTSLDQLHDCSLDESTSFSELSDSSNEERVLDESKSTRRVLFPGAQFSNHEFSVALLSIFQKHSLTYSAVEDLLKLFHCVLPTPSTLPTSQHMLFKEFISYDTNTILHRCCDSCCQLLSSGKCSRRECQASNIRGNFCGSND